MTCNKLKSKKKLRTIVLSMASVRALALIVALRSAAAWIGPRKSKFNNGLRKSPHLSGTATVADADESKLALSYFLDDEDAIIKPTSGMALLFPGLLVLGPQAIFHIFSSHLFFLSGGVNNIVQYVETSKGKNYILRIYNNGCDTPRVKFEHSVLEQLDINGAAKALPFQLPQFSKAKADGSTMAELPSGTMSCVCQTIPGGLPKTADPRPLGRAAGQLLIELGKIDPSKLEGESCHPYADIYAAHPKVSKDLFYEYIKGPELDSCRDAINDLQAEFSNLDIFIEDYRQKGIPQVNGLRAAFNVNASSS